MCMSTHTRASTRNHISIRQIVRPDTVYEERRIVRIAGSDFVMQNYSKHMHRGIVQTLQGRYVTLLLEYSTVDLLTLSFLRLPCHPGCLPAGVDPNCGSD